MKILVVDDSKAMRMIVLRTLRQTSAAAGAEVAEAADGHEALEHIRADAPDLVLSDWNMPGMSGLELLDRLNAEGSQIPFGFVTSESSSEMFERAIASGAKFLVTKPFTPESLQRALATVA